MHICVYRNMRRLEEGVESLRAGVVGCCEGPDMNAWVLMIEQQITFLLFWGKVSMCSPGCPITRSGNQTQRSPNSPSWVLVKGHVPPATGWGAATLLTNLLYFLFLGDRASCSSGWYGTFYVAKTDLKSIIFLPLHLKCWDYRYVPPCLVWQLIVSRKPVERVLNVYKNTEMALHVVLHVLIPWSDHYTLFHCIEMSHTLKHAYLYGNFNIFIEWREGLVIWHTYFT